MAVPDHTELTSEGGRLVNAPSRFSLVIVLAVAATAFVLGAMTGLPAARASATHVYTLRAGDKVKDPDRPTDRASLPLRVAHQICSALARAIHAIK